MKGGRRGRGKKKDQGKKKTEGFGRTLKERSFGRGTPGLGRGKEDPREKRSQPTGPKRIKKKNTSQSSRVVELSIFLEESRRK